MQLSQNRKIISEYIFAFCEFRCNFEHFQKRMTLVADVFSNLPTPEDGVR